jgi:hypothetical protein
MGVKDSLSLQLAAIELQTELTVSECCRNLAD